MTVIDEIKAVVAERDMWSLLVANRWPLISWEPFSASAFGASRPRRSDDALTFLSRLGGGFPILGWGRRDAL